MAKNFNHKVRVALRSAAVARAYWRDRVFSCADCAHVQRGYFEVCPSCGSRRKEMSKPAEAEG